jgi:Zn-dependent metalloprotease
MKIRAKRANREAKFRLAVACAVWGVIIAVALWNPFGEARVEGAGSGTTSDLYKRMAPNFDLNASRGLQNLRPATTQQIQALNNLKTATGSPNATARWNSFGGSIDAVYDFASAPLSGTPEEAARSFISQNAALFGVSNINDLTLFSQKDALGGHLLRFKQTFNGVDVKDGGVGVALNGNNQVMMASGPFFRDVNVNTTPALSADQAAAAADANLAQFRNSQFDQLSNLFGAANNLLTQQLGSINNEPPHLGIYPTADGYKLVWKVARFSLNPFGAYLISVDANTGEIVARKDYISFQAPTFTGDIYPQYPKIDDNLKNNSVISDCSGAPCGQVRATLRNFDATNVATGLNGTLTGTHALVNNILVSKLPFAQAATGTWHFRTDSPPLEARTNEQDQFAEPAEHQDEINAFFFVNYLIEYVDYLHVGGDNTQIGGGAFPDDYPNKTIPLPATVHMPNYYYVTPYLNCTNNPPSSCPALPDPTDPDLRLKVLGMDNAFAVPASALFEAETGVKMPVVVNPTFYGHGYLFNDLALEGTVPYHEGMHSVTTPIAGLEGGDEASALNEGQADEWAFTITNNPSLGDYVVNAKGYRARLASVGRDPDSVAYIRSGRSTLKYSDIGTLFYNGGYNFEEHYDGEIYMSTMWDVREMFNRLYPQLTYVRPLPSTGLPQKQITKGTNIFERDFLGAMYVLGTTAPDTMVKARDAMIVADQLLYPSDSTDPDAPGKHRALIEQVFAAHELGVNAQAVTSAATISTQVTDLAGSQAAPAVPQNVQVASSGPRNLAISWDAVSGALSYEVLKRKIGFENRRQPNGKREFIDGDASTTGFRHVAYVNGNQLSHVDKGPVHEVFAPEGLNDLFDSDYVVRAIGIAPNGQLGWSNLSGAARAIKANQDLTSQFDTAISNISFSNGVLAFDDKLTNARGSLSTDRIAYAPINFQITSISNPTVTVKNADVNGNIFVYNQTLTLGQTSAAKNLQFNDPGAQLFTFDAKITANAFFSSTVGTGSQSGDGTSNPPPPVTYSVFHEDKSGTLLAGEPSSFVTGDPSPTYGDPNFKGITWDDIEVVTKPDALFIDGTLSSTLARDMDLELRTTDGQIIARSDGPTASEHVFAAIRPNTHYVFRVKGWANGPTDYNIASDQLLPQGSSNANAGTRTIGGNGFTSSATGGSAITRLFRFTVNPVLKTVSISLLR